MTFTSSFTGYFYPYSLFSNVSSESYNQQDTLILTYNGIVDFDPNSSHEEILNFIYYKHCLSETIKTGDVVVLSDSVYTINNSSWLPVSFFPEKYWHAKKDFIPNL